MDTGTLRTVLFKEVYEGIVSRMGLDPSLPVPHNLWQAIPRNVNKVVKTAWTYWEWPYLEVCDERAFARTWLSDHQFAAGEAVIYVQDLHYYQALSAPPIGTPPTNTTYWAPLEQYGNFIAFDQICRRPMGMVLGAYRGDPRCNGHGHHGFNFQPLANGIAVCGTSGPTVFLKYQLPVPRFSLTPYAPGRAYQTGKLVYDAITGECYIAVAPSQAAAPPDATFWLKQEFPAVFEDYVVAAAYASCLKETTQAAEPADQQQMRMMWAREAETEAEEKLVEEIDKLRAMGQRYHYRAWRSCAHGIGHGVCASVPCFDPNQGTLAGPPVTTLKEICESDPTAPGPPPPGSGGGDGGDGGDGGTVISDSGITALLNGQGYVDVAFLLPQTNANWIFVECQVVNTDDATPLNIWPGIITGKTAEGFRLQLNGLPDSGNYYLHWAITPGAAPPTIPPATTYSLSGPSSGMVSVPSANFTVQLPAGTTLPAPVTVTPADGGAGGTFTPASVVLTAAAPSATFKYTPASTGAKTISVTNDGGLSDPASRTYTSNPNTTATTYTLTGPTGGTVSVASTNFTVALPGGSTLASPVTVTPHDGGAGGTFTPATVNLSTGTPSATFTYTPASTGAKTISTTNSSTLTNPGSLTYTVSSASLSDGDPVSSWPDSSGNGHNATQTGSARPIFKKPVIGGKPVVRFTSANSQFLALATPVSSNTPYTFFVVMKPATSLTLNALSSAVASANNNPYAFQQGTTVLAFTGRDSLAYLTPDPYQTAFHVFMVQMSAPGSSSGLLNVDGTGVGLTASVPITPVSNNDFVQIGKDAGAVCGDGDIAEMIFYNTVSLASGTPANIIAALGTKYGIATTGGTGGIPPNDPSVVANLVAWWKADSLG